ncbi:MAG TPA: carboxypeptidase-like regulatory domain-containing protein [Bryobacteraceae bacterium]
MRLIPAFLIAAALWAQDTGSVEGTVINSVTGVGIGGATVHLNASVHYETVTDGAGTFQFSGIKPGDYEANVEKSLFTPGLATSFPPPRIHVGSGKDPIRLRFELLPPATLRGRVFGIDGKPAAHAKVDLGREGLVVTANEDGSFVFENVEPRSYTLTARPPAASAAFMQDGARMEILPTYFPSVLDSNAAQQIDARPGSDQGGFDIQLQAAPVFRVRGVLLGPEGKPEANALVEVLSKTIAGDPPAFLTFPFGPFSIAGPTRGASYALIEPAVTKADGSFEFPSIPVGDWTLRAESDAEDVPGAQHQIQFHGNEDIRLGRTDVDDVRIQLLPVFDLGLSVEFADGSRAPSQNGRFPLSFGPVDGGIPVSGEVRQNRVENLQAGTYRLSDGRMMYDGAYYPARVLLGNTDVTGQPVQLSPSSPPIRIILGPAATLRGVVDKGEGAAVILWPQTTMPGDFGRSIPCGAAGAFETRGLPPGDYYAIAVERHDPREMTSAAYLQGMIPRATSVRIEEGATVSLDLNLTR